MKHAFGANATTRTRALTTIGLAALIALTALAAAPAADAKPDRKRGLRVKVMTRNIFLGADLTPGLEAANFEQFIEANGAILREVDFTNFPRRAEGLASEIAEKKPDLLGLQEVALWRTGKAAIEPAVPGPPVATTVRYDFLENLRAELRERGLRYKVAASKDEFDFEAPADYNDIENDGPLPAEGNPNDDSPNDLNDAEINGRLTMRDVILVNKESKVKAKARKPETGTFENLFTPNIAGLDVPVTRGFTAVKVKVKKKKGKGKNREKVKKRFHFVNAHLEAFDDETQVPSIRALQAQELLDGPADHKKVILLGDFNSDVPGVQPGDEQAYQTLLDGGFRERSTDNPLSCCVSDLFTSLPAEFDHQVDHIMSNQGRRRVKLVNSSVTGLERVAGIYSSDHAGVFSTLKIR